MNRWVYVAPIVTFALIAFFLFRSLMESAPDILPSPLIDKSAPGIDLPPVDARTPGFSRADLASGHVTVVNFFASWCIPCRAENQQLLALASMPGVTVYGVDYKEREAGAGRAFLDKLGNPFSRLVADETGRRAIDWGVYGVPETFVVDGKGIVRFKMPELALTPTSVRQQLLPEIEKARQLPLD